MSDTKMNIEPPPPGTAQDPMTALVTSIGTMMNIVRSPELWKDPPPETEGTRPDQIAARDKWQDVRERAAVTMAMLTIGVIGDIAISLHRIADAQQMQAQLADHETPDPVRDVDTAQPQ